MWYFAWVLGTALAVSFGVLNALWYEIKTTNEHSCQKNVMMNKSNA